MTKLDLPEVVYESALCLLRASVNFNSSGLTADIMLPHEQEVKILQEQNTKFAT